MLTGTPLDLTFIPELLEWLGAAIPIAWLLLLLAAIGLVMWKVRSLAGRLLGVAGVLVLLVALPIWKLGELRKQAVVARAENDAEQAKFRERLAVAEAQFKKRCETAGEFIYKTVPDVKGVVWMKWRPRGLNFGDQFKFDDPYGQDCSEEECLQGLLRSTFVTPNRDMNKPTLPLNGYEFVETTDPRDMRMYRYTAGVKALRKRTPAERALATRNNGGADPGEYVFGFSVQREAISAYSVRYGITWDDISTREDRENWIAGGAVSIVDTHTGEIIAKRVGYMMDRGLGNTAGFRSPWSDGRSNKCGNLADANVNRGAAREAAEFAFKVVRPIQGATK